MSDQQMPNGFADNYGDMQQGSAQSSWQTNQNQYAQPQQGYNAYPQQNPYTQQQGYTGYQAGQVNPYGQQAYVQNPYQGGQQNPYAQQSYAPNGYQAQTPNGYQQNGYPQNAYQQNTYSQNAYQQNAYQQQPANPYQPYVQQQGQSVWQQPQQAYQQQAQQPYQQMQQPAYQPYQPVPPTADVHQPRQTLPLILIAVSVVVVLMFILALVLNVPVMKWISAIVAVFGIAALWLIPGAADGYARIGASGVYALLALVCVLLALLGGGTTDPAVGPSGTPEAPGNTSGVGTIISDLKTPSPQEEEGIGDDWDVEPSTAPVVSVPTAENDLDGVCARQLRTFFSYWSVNDTETMVSLCAPSWQKTAGEPKKALFSILSNRSPVNYELKAISGTDQDASRTITVEAEIDKRNGNATALYSFKVVMLNENENWYVDPRSLESSEAAATATATNVFPTQPPTPEPATADTLLYYNEDGGHYYHSDPNCSKIGSKYRPLKASFRYSQINDSKYKDLIPCNNCGSPLRNQ